MRSRRTVASLLTALALSAVVAVFTASVGAVARAASSPVVTHAAAAAKPAGHTETRGGKPPLPGTGRPTFVLGDKNFTEEYIVADLYQQALEAQGYTVRLAPSVGSTEAAYAALKAGRIDGYPEYDGMFLSTVAGMSANPASAKAAASESGRWAQAHGYMFTRPTPFSDSDAIAVLKSYASRYHLRTIGDLRKLGKRLKLGAAPGFRTRYPDGLIGLKRAYGVDPTFDPMNVSSFYPQLDSGKIDAATVFTTDPELKSGKYVVLKDTKAIFGFENVGLIVKRSTLTAEGPVFLDMVDEVSRLLTQKAIIDLNAEVELGQQSPAAAAKAFLKANDML